MNYKSEVCKAAIPQARLSCADDEGGGMIKEPEWARHVLDWSPTGSRVICDPPPTDTDEDWVCFQPQYDAAIAALEEDGFKSEGSPKFYTGNNRGSFRSLRKGNVNLILTDQREFFDLFVSATELAKRFNLREKADRIALFQVVLYGVEAHNLEA